MLMSTMQSRRVLVVCTTVVLALISRTDATSSCSSNYDQNDCENSCTVYSSDCIFASDCTASMHYQYNGWAGYKSCECIKTYTNGSSTTYKLCQDGPTGLGYWILFCCCGCCCVAGALMMHQKTQRDRRQREAAAAAQVQHQHPPAAPMYPQADQYNSPGFAQPTGAYGQPAYGQPAYPPPPFSGAPPGYDEASSRESQGMYPPPQGGAALYPPEKGDMGSTAI